MAWAVLPWADPLVLCVPVAARSPVGVGDLAEAGERAPQLVCGLLAQVLCPFGLDRPLCGPRDGDRGLPSRCDMHQPGPGIGGVWCPADVARSLQLVDKE